MKVWIEQGVVWNLQPKAQEGFRHVVKLFKKHKKDVFVTSGAEGDHMPDSLHYCRRAWDQRNAGFKKSEILKALPGGGKFWDVIEYPKWNGLHIEYDPKLEVKI